MTKGRTQEEEPEVAVHGEAQPSARRRWMVAGAEQRWKARCPYCGKSITVTTGNVLWRHRVGMGGPRVICEGSGRVIVP